MHFLILDIVWPIQKYQENTIWENSCSTALIKPIKLFLPQQENSSKNNSSYLRKHHKQYVKKNWIMKYHDKVQADH